MSAAPALSICFAASVGGMRIQVDLDTAPGTLVIVGPNGAGKTSLLDVVLGARAVEQGRITVGGTVLLDTQAGVDLPVEDRRLGYVPQDYALFPHLSVRDNVTFALRSARPALGRAARLDEATALLREVGLEAVADRRPRTLSGGEQQKLALARALSVAPRALLLDEPLAALDVHARRELRAFLRRHLERAALPTVIVTHDPDDARELGHRIAVMEVGQITQVGTWADLQRSPASPFVAELTAPTPT